MPQKIWEPGPALHRPRAPLPSGCLSKSLSMFFHELVNMGISLSTLSHSCRLITFREAVVGTSDLQPVGQKDNLALKLASK